MVQIKGTIYMYVVDSVLFKTKTKKNPNINKINVFISPKTLDRKCCQKHYIHITPYIDNEQHKFFKTLYSFIIYKIEKWGF